MAFNPFDLFRRNQRILFAGLTIVIMLIFTLSFGQGDILSALPQWLASTQRSGEVVAEVNGRKLYQSEVGDTALRRTLANQYMATAAEFARENLRTTAAAAIPKATAATGQVVREVLDAQARGFLDQQTLQQLQFAQMGFGQAPSRDQVNASAAAGLETAQARLAAVARTATADGDQQAVTAALRAIEVDVKRSQGGGRQRNAHYFFNQPALTDRDAVDFRLWLKKADDLGIRFTDEDVQQLARQEFYQSLTQEDWLKAQNATISGARPELARELLSALGDEFRVRAAQGAVIGQSYLVPSARLYEAPLEFYRFYREQTARGVFGVITVPAANYLDRVTGEPTEAELRDLFKKGESTDPNPQSPTIGLREPRKLKIEYVQLTGDEPFYKEATQQATEAIPALVRVAGLLSGPVPALAYLPVAYDPSALSQKAYQEYVRKHNEEIGTYWAGGGFGLVRVSDTHLASPATLGLVLGMAGDSPLQAAVAMAGGAVVADRDARLATLPPALVMPLASGDLNLAALAAMVAPQVVAIAPLPKAAVQSRLDREAKETLAKSLAEADLTKFIDEMTKLSAKPGDPAARAKATEFAKARGVEVKSSTEFGDFYSIHADPGLAALKALVEAPMAFNPVVLTPYQKERSFGMRLFSKSDLRQPQPVPARDFFAPATVDGGPPAVPTTLFWRSDEKPEERLRAFNAPATRAKLVAAWQRLEARKLALAEAERLAKEAENSGTNTTEIEQKLRDLQAKLAASFQSPEAQAGVRYFQIADVARIVQQVSAGQNQVALFNLAETEDIPHPTAAMESKLLEAKEKSPSASVVLTDAPGDRHYVATLLYRIDPDAGQFATLVYGDRAVASQLAGPVRSAYQYELRERLRADAVALLKAEYGYAKETDGLDRAAGG